MKRYIGISLNITVAISVSAICALRGVDYLEKLNVFAPLITATSLYFAILMAAMNSIKEIIVKLDRYVKNAKSGDASDSDTKSVEIIVSSMNDLRDLPKKTITYLNNQIWLIVSYIVLFLVKELSLTFDLPDFCFFIIFVSLYSVTLYVIFHTLFIIKDTASGVIKLHRLLNSEEMLDLK